MQLVEVQSRDIYMLLEFSIEEIKQITLCCDHIQINFDGKDKKETKAADYFVKTFYPQLKTIITEIEKQYDSALNKKTE